jgi:hypothetical protein
MNGAVTVAHQAKVSTHNGFHVVIFHCSFSVFPRFPHIIFARARCCSIPVIRRATALLWCRNIRN